MANDKIRIGCIGVGGMGTNDMKGFMRFPDVEVVAVCDVDSKNLSRAASVVMKEQGRMPVVHQDFRRVLDMKDVDAVTIGTPDHWHALPFILACEAGKDVFCEKPISHDIWEGQMMVGAAKNHKTVVQINTWQRSVPHFQRAIEFIRSGGAGTVRECRAWILGGGGLGKNPIKNPPPNLDWDFWCGPAPKVPYHDNIHPGKWRAYYDFGTGAAGDWGVHMIDIVLLGMNAQHPLEVSSVGGKFVSGEGDDRTTPDTQMSIFKFKDFIMNWEVHVKGEGLDDGPMPHGSEFIGDKGKLIVDRTKITWKPYGDNPGPKEIKDPEGRTQGWANADHIRDFLDNVRSRGKCVSDIESMYYTTACCHLMNVSYQVGRSITWDGEKGIIVGDKDAMRTKAFRRDYRKPWKLPYYKWNV